MVATPKKPYFARAIVAMEMPVDPTVPSKMREPVWGCRRPLSSASLITKCTFVSSARQGKVSKVVLRKATRSLTLPPGFMNCDFVSDNAASNDKLNTTSAFPKISTPKALLRELILTSGVLPDVDSEYFQTGHWVENEPIRPATPSTTSSLRSSMGRGSKDVAPLFRFRS